ncbi:MAG: hypothetical protein HYT63_01830 [Candidatus Yanofskybacteria bacterium]|nr:hypothetical protein [Candidatus Yanofskybacteria bacterium]
MKKENNKKKIKYYLILIGICLGLLLFLDLFTLNSNIFNLKGSVRTMDFKKTAEIRITGLKGDARAFSGEVVKGMTILDALLASAESANFRVEYLIEKENLENLLINGLSDSLSVAWQAYLNGKSVNIKNLNSIKIKSGDLMEFKLKPAGNESK